MKNTISVIALAMVFASCNNSAENSSDISGPTPDSTIVPADSPNAKVDNTSVHEDSINAGSNQ